MSAHWAAAAIILALFGLSAVLIFEQRCREKNRDVTGFADRYNRRTPKETEAVMARNTELLEAVMQHITDHPEQHEQRWWFTQTDCGTAACFAGWACLLSGMEKNSGSFEFVSAGGETRYTLDAAVELLGISDGEADVLFDAHNTRDMLQLMVKDLVNGDDLEPQHTYDRGAS